ncbi:MAG: glutamate-1-semialdehyde-2,1-aminomutase [Flavobacteriales bacterium]|nr:glutamate-1-semialdehyde-2,1-aminomutase [Flavobacteriales bacterium]|tara:strand:- start:949 stop:2256 length:1308 start_codon:yes stop_codon:yes gene_type:complete
MKRTNSNALYQISSQYFPGGVNSPVRAFRSVDGTPIFITKGNGAYVTDADDNNYIDFCASWGPLILGHNHKKIKDAVIEAAENGLSFGAPTIQENELAALLIKNNRFVEKIRFVSSGTEAVMSAIRLARGYTKRDKIIKFEGCYHGHADHLLVKAGSGLVTFGSSSSAGVPEAIAKETLVLPLNNKEALIKAFEEHKEEVACVIIEPVPANNGLLLQDKEYLEFVKKIAHENCALVIFDEVISGFRVGFEGAAGYYDIQPDIITYGKIIGGGIPAGCYGSSAKIMSYIAPDGDVYQAGTLSGNPIAMSAGRAALTELLKDGFYEDQQDRTQKFVNKIKHHIDQKGYNIQISTIGSIFWMVYGDQPQIQSPDQISKDASKYFKAIFSKLLQKGVYLGPSGFEVGFVSAAHSDEILDEAANKINTALDEVNIEYNLS